MRHDLVTRILAAALLCLAAACARSGDKETTKAAATPATPAPPAAPQPAATGAGEPTPAADLSISEVPIVAIGSGDSMMMATVGAITRLRDAAKLEALARDAFAAADVDKDSLLTRDEFAAALDHIDAREQITQALGGGRGRSDIAARGVVFDAAGGKSGAVSQEQFNALFDLKRVEADRDYDGRLDDAEYGRFRALINGADGAN